MSDSLDGRLRLEGWKRRVVLLLMALFLLAAVLVCVRNGGSWLEQIGSASWSVRPGLLAGSILLLLVSYLLTPLGWVMISRALGSQVPSSSLASVWYVSQLGRYVPGKVWLFAGRAAYLRSTGMRLGRAAFTTGLEVLLTIASVGLVVLVSVWFVDEAAISDNIRLLAVISSASVLLLPVLGPVQRALIRRGQRRRGDDEPEEIPGFPVRRTAGIACFYGLLWLMRGFSLLLWLMAFGLEGTHLPMVLLATPLAWLAGYVAFLAPGGLGVREAVLVSLLSGPAAAGPVLLLVFGQRVLLGLFEVTTALVRLPSMRHVFFDRTAPDTEQITKEPER